MSKFQGLYLMRMKRVQVSQQLRLNLHRNGSRMFILAIPEFVKNPATLWSP